MALIPHSFFPRSAFDMDVWHPRALDVFDPFDELDTRSLSTMVNWLERPSWLQPNNKVPQKYRITVDCAGFDPKSIKMEVVDDKLSVSGNEGALGATGEDFAHRSFKRTYQLPKLVAADKMTSFMDRHGMLVIDMPYKVDEPESMWPQVLHAADGKHKEVHLNLHLPEHIDSSKVHVTAKDHDIIVKAEDKAELPNGYGKFYYYRRSTMPASTDMSGLKCSLDDSGKLSIVAPFIENALKHDHHSSKAIKDHHHEREHHKSGVFTNLFHKKEKEDAPAQDQL